MFWNFYAVMNMVTDMGPIILMIIITSRIHTSLSRKITVAGVFGSRVVYVPFLIFNLPSLFENQKPLTNQSFPVSSQLLPANSIT